MTREELHAEIERRVSYAAKLRQEAKGMNYRAASQEEEAAALEVELAALDATPELVIPVWETDKAAGHVIGRHEQEDVMHNVAEFFGDKRTGAINAAKCCAGMKLLARAVEDEKSPRPSCRQVTGWVWYPDILADLRERLAEL